MTPEEVAHAIIGVLGGNMQDVYRAVQQCAQDMIRQAVAGMQERCAQVAEARVACIEASKEDSGRKFQEECDERIAECQKIAAAIRALDRRQDGGQRADSAKHSGPPHLGGA